MCRLQIVLVILALFFLPAGYLPAQSNPTGGGRLNLEALDNPLSTGTAPVGNSGGESPVPVATTDSSTAGGSNGNESRGESATIPHAATGKSQTLISLLLAGGWIGLVILLLSVIAGSLIVFLLATLQRSVIVPPRLRDEVMGLLQMGRVLQARDHCRQDISPYAKAVYVALLDADGPLAVAEENAENRIAQEMGAIYRKVDYLSVIGNIAPMLGLLGTVVGMVLAFGELATSDGLGRNLAQGIYFALVTTVEGLLVAIPSLVAYSLLNNRVAELSVYLTEQVDGTLRLLRRQGNLPPPPPQRGR